MYSPSPSHFRGSCSFPHESGWAVTCNRAANPSCTIVKRWMLDAAEEKGSQSYASTCQREVVPCTIKTRRNHYDIHNKTCRHICECVHIPSNNYTLSHFCIIFLRSYICPPLFLHRKRPGELGWLLRGWVWQGSGTRGSLSPRSSSQRPSNPAPPRQNRKSCTAAMYCWRQST